MLRLTVLPAVTNGDDRLDLMLIPQPVDQLVVVVALVGAQSSAPLQQLRVALLHLIKQELRLRLLGTRRLGDLERQRQLVAGVHHQVQQVAEPGVSVLAGALDAPVGIPVAAPVAVFLGLVLRQRIAALALGQGVQLLAVQRRYLSQIRQLDLERCERALEQLLQLRLIPAQQLTPQGGDAGMLKDEAGDQRVPQRAHRIVVAAVSASGLQQLHQRFAGEGVEDQLQALEITELVDAVPAEKGRFWYSGQWRFSCCEWGFTCHCGKLQKGRQLFCR